MTRAANAEQEALAVLHGARAAERRRGHDDGDGARLDDDAAVTARPRLRSVGDEPRDVAGPRASRSRSRSGA